MLVIALLLFAAMMKSWQLLTAQFGGVGIFFEPRFILFTVIFEITFAAWLASGILLQQAWVATVGLFTLFSLISCSKALSGAVTCGCLGVLKINPRVMASIDCFVILTFLLGCQNFRIKYKNHCKKRLLTIFLLWGLACLTALGAFFSVHKNEHSKVGVEFTRFDGSKSIVLDPKNWSDGSFPILQFVEPIDVREKMKAGNWRVIVYRHDCTECQKLLSHLEPIEGRNTVCIEVPPYGESEFIADGFVKAKLTDSSTWFIETPVIIDQFCFFPDKSSTPKEE